MASVLEWTVDVKDVGEAEIVSTLSATETERLAVAKVLDLVTCSELDAEYKIRPRLKGCYRLTGRLTAHVVQSCIVTLDPVPSEIVEEFDAEFRPEEAADETPSTRDRAVLEGFDVEPLTKNRIEIGRIVFEHLSAVLDPYPRKPGAEFEWKGERDEAELRAKANPFSVLAKLKPERDEPGT